MQPRFSRGRQLGEPIMTSKQLFSYLEFLVLPAVFLWGMVCCRHDNPGANNLYVICKRHADIIQKIISSDPEAFLGISEDRLHCAIASVYDRVGVDKFTGASNVVLKFDAGFIVDPWGNSYVIELNCCDGHIHSTTKYHLTVLTFGSNGISDKGVHDDMVFDFEF